MPGAAGGAPCSSIVTARARTPGPRCPRARVRTGGARPDGRRIPTHRRARRRPRPRGGPPGQGVPWGSGPSTGPTGARNGPRPCDRDGRRRFAPPEGVPARGLWRRTVRGPAHVRPRPRPGLRSVPCPGQRKASPTALPGHAQRTVRAEDRKHHPPVAVQCQRRGARERVPVSVHPCPTTPPPWCTQQTRDARSPRHAGRGPCSRCRPPGAQGSHRSGTAARAHRGGRRCRSRRGRRGAPGLDCAVPRVVPEVRETAGAVCSETSDDGSTRTGTSSARTNFTPTSCCSQRMRPSAVGARTSIIPSAVIDARIAPVMPAPSGRPTGSTCLTRPEPCRRHRRRRSGRRRAASSSSRRPPPEPRWAPPGPAGPGTASPPAPSRAPRAPTGTAVRTPPRWPRRCGSPTRWT